MTMMDACENRKNLGEMTDRELMEDIESGKYWNPNAMDSLIYNPFAGAAAIFIYEKGSVELIRANDKYIRELGMNASEQNVLEEPFFEGMDDEDRANYDAAIKKAMSSWMEAECDSWIDMHSKCCGYDRVCIRSTIQLIGLSKEQHLFYLRIKNITEEKMKYEDLAESEKKFRMASEQSNTFAWEYEIATKIMRPCARCMRVLGLPPVLENYPEPVIESGLFPEEVADKYRQWHKLIAEGKEHLEGIIPLTPDRVPFMVKYTTEFDEEGNPVRAYGSATEIKGYDMNWLRKNSL